MVDQLKTLINLSNALYEVEYEESRMMNLKADEKSLDACFAYIEEFVQGTYEKPKYHKLKTTRVQIYFCRFCEMHNTAIQRNAIRNQIESEVVLPFMDNYNASGLFQKVETFRFFTPLPRFDANEVSIMLEFDCKQFRC